jgi:hypothetical protein
MSETEILNGIRWTAPAEHRVYTPPAEPEQFVAPRVSAHAVKVDGSAVEQAHAAIAHANKAFQKHLDETNSTKHLYTDEGYRGQIAKFAETSAAKSVNQAVEQVQARRDQAAADVEKFRRNLSRPGDAAQESRNDRYWNRTKPLLDKAGENGVALHLAEDLLAKASRDEVSVLVEELGAYFDARGFKLERVNRSTGEVTDLLDEAIARVLPEYATAKAKLKVAKQAAIIVERGAHSVRQGFAQGRAVSPAILQTLASSRHDPDR